MKLFRAINFIFIYFFLIYAERLQGITGESFLTLASFLTRSVFHSELKTWLSSKSFPPQTFSFPTRMAPERPAHSAIDWIPVDGRKRRGRPRPGAQLFVTTYMQEESAEAKSLTHVYASGNNSELAECINFVVVRKARRLQVSVRPL